MLRWFFKISGRKLTEMGTPASTRARWCKRILQRGWCGLISFILGTTAVLLPLSVPAPAHRNDQPGILILYYRQKEAPYAHTIREEIVQVLAEQTAASFTVYDESVEGWKETGEATGQAVVDVLRERYSRMNVHVLVPVGNRAVEFARRHGHEITPEASIVYMAESFSEGADKPAIANATGVVARFEPEDTLQLALQQNPTTRQVVVVSGSSAQEKMELLATGNRYRPYEHRLRFRYLTDVTFAELLSRLAHLPEDAVVILLNFSRDSAGDEFIGTQVLPSISRASARPVYVVYGPGVGSGAVGGRVHDFGQIGRALGGLVAQILNGKKAADLPVVEGTFQAAIFDARQLKRWGIKEKQLPKGSIILNHEVTIWEKYRWWILGTFALLGAQAGLIAFLTLTHMRRIRAERELAKQVELEQLISELATAFVNIPTGQVGEQIEHSCNRLLRFFQVDRIAIFEFTEEKETLRLLYSYRTAGTSGFPESLASDRLPWVKSEVLAGKPVLVSRLEEMPATAALDRQYMQGREVRSLAIVPLIVRQEVSGILVLSAVQQEVQWSAEAAERLQTISHIFANALDNERSQEALKASEDLKARILDSMISHLVVINRTGKIISVNKGWKDYWGANGGRRDGDMGIGANYLEVCRRSAQAGCRDADRALAGILSVLNGSAETFEMEYDSSPPDRLRRFIMVVTPLHHLGEGAVIRHRDITFRTQALRMLRESEQRFRLVADSAPVMIWMAGPDRLCNYFNKSWLDFRGRPIEQEAGDGWKDGIHPEDLARCLRTYNESFDLHRPFTIEYRMRRADGDLRWVLESGTPRALPDGTFAGFIGACVDITEQKESDRARAQLSGLLITAQEQERASIARELHDHVNQRLALLAIELQQFEASAGRLSKEERAEVERLWDLTNDISHDVQTLSHQLHSSQLQHLGLVAGIRSLCQEFSKSNGVEAECRCGGAIPKIDENVSLALFRVAQEALRNASKYSRASSVTAELQCDQDVLLLRVADDGAGFDPASVNGDGLGLISMRERMRLIGGELAVQSKPGGGTQVEARVPLVHELPAKIPPGVSLRVERRKRTRA